jgi:protein TonB
MFDRLIESDTLGADFKSRRRYFLVSTVVVGALFISAVVFSIYASDIGLGNETYELTAILTPVEPPRDAPEPPEPQKVRRAVDVNTNDVPTRVIRQLPIDVPPRDIPPVSSIPNRYLSIPDMPYKMDTTDSQGTAQPKTTGTGTGSAEVGTNNNTGTSADQTAPVKTDPPPPVEKPKTIQSLGVINGKATKLPPPPYPAAAAAMGVQGAVNVQVTIDEEGNVISAKAASGNMLLRDAAVNAAWKAKFTPTYLSKVPVKVTGVIVYNFRKN